MDVDGRYRGLDQNIHQADGFTNHTIFSLWDTYRAEHPLLTLLKPKRAADMVQSMLKHQQQSVHKMLPIWSHMANDNWCMTGYHAVSVLADAFDAGIATDTFDILTAMNQTSKVDYFDGLDDYQRLGYVPFDHSATSTSTTLEYALNDWAIYRTALNAGNLPMAREYRRRALNYRNVYDPTIGYARPRLASGEFKKDFNILQTSGEGFIEGNSQNFSFHVPHDVAGIIDLMGGEAAFRHKLDELFANDLPEEYYADNEDVTSECLIGGYVHGNEPSHHIPYLYAWTSEPWKTQHWVREIMNRMYRPEIRGLGGNDDCGQMSAWYVFSALGFYPVCPGTGQFVLGAPYIPYAKITLPNGKTFEVKAPRVSDKNRYVKEVKLNGKPHSKLYLTRSDILDGGVLEFVMTDKPNTRRGLNRDDKPYSLSTETWTDYPTGYVNFIDKAPESAGSQIYHSIVPNPQEYIARQARQVLNTLYFSPMDSIVPVDTIHYTLEDRAGVSAKDGDNGIVSVFYSTRHVENSFANNDTAKVDFETRGVLLHELTHAFQLEPQGVGTYSTNPIFYAFIEGMADAVRIYNGGFHDETDRPKGGNYDDGYRTTGYFLVWLTKNKDSDFLRKFNRTALEVIPWSFDGAMQKVLGPDVTAAELWREYQLSLGEEMD